MGEFYDCGQHYPPCTDRRLYLSLSGETAVMIDRETHLFESWIDGRCISRGGNQTTVTNAIHKYRDIRSRYGIDQAQFNFPDID